jgi:cytochrome c biogenesis protein CcmG/thiol:disulfide interchange protein DsbE
MDVEEVFPEEAPAPRRWGALFAWVLLFAVLGLVGYGLVKANRGPLELNRPAPNFELTTFEGERFRTEELRGQVILVNIWASWCVTCKDEARELEQAYQMYKDQGVVFLGVDWSDTESKALAYLDEYGITYPNGPDIGGQIYRAFRVRGVPETYLIAADGTLASFKIGAYSSLAEIVAAIETAMQP